MTRNVLFILFKIILLNVLLVQTIFASDNSFVDDQTCASCHRTEFQQWQTSHHALAMQIANTNTVLGNFNQAEFDYKNVKIKFFSDHGRYYIDIISQEGNSTTYLVKYTFGVSPLQQYLVQFPNGKLQAFPIAWDIVNKKWFHLTPDENMAPGDSLYWGKRYYNWNFSCADCHSTDLHKNYSAITQSYNTTWSEINVGCQACHGPGKDHIVWAHALLKGKTLNTANEGLSINYKTMNAKQFVETCAFCHARRHPIISNPQYGTPLLNNYVPEILRANVYYPDGSIQDEDYEYGSFIQSKMYKNGVVCTDCHNPHTALIKVNTNGLCTQCHNANPPLQRFPTLPIKNYDTPAHTHHLINSPGSACISCHMPTRTYMNVDVRRDHYFRIPRPDLTIKYGIPNACNACHKDKSPQWAQQTIEKWYGKIDISNDYTDLIAAGREQQPQVEQQLIQLASDNSQSNIVRASVAYLLHDYNSPDSLQALIALSKNSDPLIRVNALDSLEPLPNNQKIPVLIPLLADPILAVRIEAARLLAPAPKDLFTSSQQVLFNKALAEYINSQQAVIDTAEANLNLAELAEAQHNQALAEQYYLHSLQLDANFYPASQNLAMLYNSENENDKAQHILEQGIAHNKDQGELYYSLGLLLAQENKFAQSAIALNSATKYMPTYAKAFYNYGLVLQHLNQYNNAEIALLKSNELNPSNPEILYALMILYRQMHQWDKAQNYADELRNEALQ